MEKEIKLSYGALSERLDVQLQKQGFKFKENTVQLFELERMAIVTLSLGNFLLTDNQAKAIRQKLHKKVVSHLKRCN